ncbi:transcription factor Tfb4 [Ascobolus immersus RN42]|uniref:General transcription and DNA repair factor IIH subunit TFB4 n=1 Tax=Ascobolus immersus RN42 TaxID=1160509 RepID=A0A3N4IN37_ASCIM|nr:transcription factor Tfb4 [Ascobolus immersus RN42]
MDRVDATEHFAQHAQGDLPSLLVLIIDINPIPWTTNPLSTALPFNTALSNLLLFLNAHLAFSHTNKVAVIAAAAPRGGGAKILYPAAELPTDTKGRPQSRPPQPAPQPGEPNKYRPFKDLEEGVLAGLGKVLASVNEEDDGTDRTVVSETRIAGALTLALAYINRLAGAGADNLGQTLTKGTGTTEAGTMQSRILVVSVAGDVASEYVPVMNCVFAAQKKHIPIDVCKVAGNSVFLQQAADATGGVYMKLDAPNGFLQYLMMAYLPDPAARQHLVLPTQANVDFRAACFCHKKVVDVGYVCSICLSIFCTVPPDNICMTCQTKLAHTVGGMVVRKKKKKKAGTATGSGAGTPTVGTPRP